MTKVQAERVLKTLRTVCTTVNPLILKILNASSNASFLEKKSTREILSRMCRSEFRIRMHMEAMLREYHKLSQ